MLNLSCYGTYKVGTQPTLGQFRPNFVQVNIKEEKKKMTDDFSVIYIKPVYVLLY